MMAVTGFDHVIANMYFVPLALMYGAPKISVGLYIWKSLIPSLIGNVLGAWLLAAPFTYYYLTGAGAFDATKAPDDVEKGGRGMREGVMGGGPEVDHRVIRRDNAPQDGHGRKKSDETMVTTRQAEDQ